MAYTLQGTQQSIRINWANWVGLVDAARRYGWNPYLLPEPAQKIRDEHGRLVSAQDAAELAAALERFMEAEPDQGGELDWLRTVIEIGRSGGFLII